MANPPAASPPLANAAAGTPSLRKLGTGATDAAAGDDARFGGAPSSASYDSGSSKIPLADATTGRITGSYLPDSGVTPGVFTIATVTVDKHGIVTAASNGTVRYQTVQSPSGTAMTQRSVLALAARLSASDDGGATIVDFADSGVTAGTYTSANVSVDRYGRVTSAANGASGSGSPNGGYEGVYASNYYVPGVTNSTTILAVSNIATGLTYTLGQVFGVSGTITEVATAFGGNSSAQCHLAIYRTSAVRSFPGTRVFWQGFSGSGVSVTAVSASCSISVAAGELIWFFIHPNDNIGGNQMVTVDPKNLFPLLGTDYVSFIGSAFFSGSNVIGYRNSSSYTTPPTTYPALSSSRLIQSHAVIPTCLFKFTPG